MFLKLETSLNVYELKSKTILCRVKVLSTKENNNKNGSSPTNICRTITPDQWNKFDNELITWLVLNENNTFDDEDTELYQFIVKPNLQINIKKSKLAIRDFLKCVNADDDDGSNGEYGFPFILDCILEHTSMPPITPTFKTVNPCLSSASYSPSKRSRRYHSEHLVKTADYDISGYAAIKDTYALKPSIINIVQDNFAPICERYTSSETEISTQNDVINETEDERMPYEEHRTIRKKSKIQQKEITGEYVSQTSLTRSHIPTYKSSEIEVVAKRESKLSPITIKPVIGRKAEGTSNDKSTPEEHKKSSKRHKKKEKHHTKEYAGESENKRSSKEKLSSNSKESEKRLSSTSSSEDDFEAALELKAQGKNKEYYKGKNRVGLAEIDKRQESDRKRKDNSSTKVKTSSLSSAYRADKANSSQKQDRQNKDRRQKEEDNSYRKITNLSLLSSDEEDKTNSSQKRDIQNKDRRQKDKRDMENIDRRQKEKHKEKREGNDREEVTKSYENISLKRPHDVQIRSLAKSLFRRSERSPTKPKRFIEEQEKYELFKKQKINRLSPLKKKELFRTHDDDDMANLSDTNNNGSDMHSPHQTTKSDKNNTHTLSARSVSPNKKKRHRDNCEQEKAGMTKWLGKKTPSKKTGSSENIGKEGTSSSKVKSLSSSSSKAKTSKKIESLKHERKERSKSPSPQSMDIVIPSKEELEVMRNKYKMQMEENVKMKAFLEKINIPTPKKVPYLSLKDMSLKELLDSYDFYRAELDKVFEVNCNKNHVKGNDGINHCVVIGLIDQSLQFKMMEKLTDVYSSTTNHTTHATIYANALLPEWIIGIFMQRYNLSRSQALEQIRDQDAYRSYMEDQNENCLNFDD